MALAQGSSHFPGQQVVVQVAVFLHFGKVVDGVVLQFLGGLFADHAPRPVALLGAQLNGPALAEQIRGLVRVFRGQSDQRQHGKLFAAAGDGQDALVQVFGGVRVDQVHLLGQAGRLDVNGQLRRAGTVRVHGDAGLAPQVQRLDLAARVQVLGHVSAAVIGIALRVPKPQRFFGHIGLAVHGFGGQGVATHLAVVTHAKARIFGGESGPIAALAQLQQPVVAQAVFVVAACVGVQKTADFSAGGGVQAGPNVPIGGQGLQHMATGLGQQGRQAVGVFFPEGLVHLQQHLVASVLGLG